VVLQRGLLLLDRRLVVALEHRRQLVPAARLQPRQQRRLPHADLGGEPRRRGGDGDGDGEENEQQAEHLQHDVLRVHILQLAEEE
jgi:hypothetical protein